MKHLKYITLMLLVVLSAACEQMQLPEANLEIKREKMTDITDQSAVIELEFYPIDATIQKVEAYYTDGLKKDMLPVSGFKYRVELSNLNSDTEYQVYYKVKNAFSSVIVKNFGVFRTAKKGKAPTVVTSAVMQITGTSAVAGGNVTADGGVTVTERGVVYSTSTNPTTNASSKVISGSGKGVFTCNLTGLKLNTTYYIRAYAKNAIGTSYGEQKSFTMNEKMTATPEYVDLGLSVKWATFNVGASKPEQYGDYFAWGETESKDSYNWSTYKWCNGSSSTLTKYNTDSSRGTVDNKTQLELSDDAAYANWGGSWRTPTDAELTELRELCTLTWTTQNGVNGYKVTGSNGNSIFLPAAGYRSGSSLGNAESGGYYWSSSLITGSPYDALYMYFNSSGMGRNDYFRYYGRSIRPVYGAQVTVPTVTTSTVTQITETTAVAGGNVTSDGGASVTERGVVYSTSANPTTANSKVTSGNGTGSFTCNLTGLQPNTTYYVRAYAVNSIGTSYGEQVTFTTLTPIVVPTVMTSTITQITETTAVAGGNVTSDGGASVTERGVVYSTSTNPTTASNKVISGSGMGAFTCNLTGLQPNTTYYVRAYAVNSIGTSYGEQVSFTTNEEVTATPEYVDLGLSVKWATFNVGASKPEQYGDYFAWGETESKNTYSWSTYKWCNGSSTTLTKYCTSSSYGTVDNKKTLELSDDAAYANWGGEWRTPTDTELTELRTQCTWTWTTQNGVKGYQVRGTNGNSIFLPAAGYRYDISLNTAGSSGYYWSSTLSPVSPDYAYCLGFSSSLVDWYYNRRYYGRSVRPVYDALVTVPTVTTSTVTQITETTAVAGGNVTSDGGASVTERGVVYSTTQNPTTVNNKVTRGGDTGLYTCNLTGLQPNTTYYVRAYAVNSKGTSYGEEVSFTTLTPIVVPTVMTRTITQITETTAGAGGNVTSDGGASVTERGVVYSTSTNPTTASNKVISGSGMGAFICNLTGLQPNTTYYVRAYAVNSKGTSYGEEVSFTTQIQKPTTPYFSVSDTKKVTFSPGNLQYHPANDEWRFAENQTNYVGNANSNCSSTYNGWIDLFGWSTSATNFGLSTSTDYNDYSGSFVDWGTNQIGADAPNTWRTLTYDEWFYLRFERPNYSELCGVAQVHGMKGLIFLPDNWVCPAGVTFKSGFHSSDGADYYAAYQTFTAYQWSKLEAAGAVFLPAAGYRHGSIVRYVQESGYYWSATENGSSVAYCLYFSSDEAYMRNFSRYRGLSVRLVKDL